MTARLSTGRAVSPLGRPRIATVRDLLLLTDGSEAYADPGALQLAPDAEHSSVSLLSTAQVDDLSFEPIQAPIETSQPFAFEPEVESIVSGMSIPPVAHEGLRVDRRDGAPEVGPAPLPKAYEIGSSTTAAGFAGGNGRFRLRLEPPILLLDGVSPSFSRPLFEHQMDAMRALLGGHVVYLAGDPGIGKREAAAAALWARFQRGEAARALVLAAESDLRSWSGTLMTWAPQLDLTVVRGDRQRRRQDWESGAHVYLTDYTTFQYDVERGALAESPPRFDVILLDSVKAANKWATHPLGAVKRLQGGDRWALAGGAPRGQDEWAAIFGVLKPDLLEPGERLSSQEWEARFSSFILRRTISDVSDDVPPVTREEVWLDLNQEHAESYEEALGQERHRLAGLGRTAPAGEIRESFLKLRKALNFAPDLFDSIKVRALLNRLAEIDAAGGKVVVFLEGDGEASGRLAPALKAYRPLVLDPKASETEQAEIIASFRKGADHKVLLAEPRPPLLSGPIFEARYFVHFDPAWNPAVRVQAEARYHPRSSVVPVHSYEFWIAGTVDERLHSLLAERGLQAEHIPPAAPPGEYEGWIEAQDWVRHVFEVGVSSKRVKRPVTGQSQSLPGTKTLRSQLLSLEPERLMAGVELLMEALGFPEAELLGESSPEGGQLSAWRDEEGQVQRVLVRVVGGDKTVGIGQAREALEALDSEPDALGVYLVTTSDFSAACKKLADESEGRLALVAGAELYRHLQILGWF